MNVLLDTHTFLWWMLDDPQLSSSCKQIIADPENTIHFSAASAWEIAIKVQLGKLPLPESPLSYVPERLAQNNIRILPILLNHALQTFTLPLHHRDPFDRLLIAQSQVETFPLLTADPLIKQYQVATLW